MVRNTIFEKIGIDESINSLVMEDDLNVYVENKTIVLLDQVVLFHIDLR